ncbi:uncharacterized protein DNG_03291 [Cephalotrichum gorgonifer]|uniref:Uncharacterized protein n=1 Tax=Cephalotrichum gorgonifer TaxID=2041049 RepID=A0AAE8MTZ5_9PEZI|nr:uncharacterized protein DNG_03291 [Cephalotrichum gorgonifer]
MSPASSPLPSTGFWLGLDTGSTPRLRREPEDRKLLMGGTRTGVVTVGEAEDEVVGSEVVTGAAAVVVVRESETVTEDVGVGADTEEGTATGAAGAGAVDDESDEEDGNVETAAVADELVLDPNSIEEYLRDW